MQWEQNVWLHEVITGALRKSLQMRHRWRESNWASFGSFVALQSDGSECLWLMTKSDLYIYF
ncbi:hypothetical protein QG37_03531 [Candidozyma auris]|nr:hypothetical protein QG37_03531 [[Candida] auris]